MYLDDVNNLSAIGVKKAKYLKTYGKFKYLVLAMMGGFFVTIGTIFSYTVGGYMDAAHIPAAKLAMGMAFSIALCLVVFAGAELFTSNNMAMTVSYLDKKTTIKDGLKVWVYCWIGNFIGSIIAAVMYIQSGVVNEEIQKLILKISESKMNVAIDELFIRAIFCNIFVCLGCWCAYKMKSESGKFIMMLLCVVAFFAAGFEHSIANMGLLTMSLLIPHPASISLGGLAYNLSVATIGNIIGGAFFVGAIYYFVSTKKEDK